MTERQSSQSRHLSYAILGLILGIAYIFQNSPRNERSAHRIDIAGMGSYLRPTQITYGKGWVQFRDEEGRRVFAEAPYVIDFTTMGPLPYLGERQDLEDTQRRSR